MLHTRMFLSPSPPLSQMEDNTPFHLHPPSLFLLLLLLNVQFTEPPPSFLPPQSLAGGGGGNIRTEAYFEGVFFEIVFLEEKCFCTYFQTVWYILKWCVTVFLHCFTVQWCCVYLENSADDEFPHKSRRKHNRPCPRFFGGKRE